MKLDVTASVRIGVAACLVIVFCPIALTGCAQQQLIERALVDASLSDAGPSKRSSAAVDPNKLHAEDAGLMIDSGMDSKVDAAANTSEKPECELDRECRMISEDLLDCSAARFVVSENDPRWAQYLYDCVNTLCSRCEGSQDALKGVCDAGKCRAVLFTLAELQACDADDDCVLGYSSPQFCYCSSSAPDPDIAYNKNRPAPGSETYNLCLATCPAVTCPVVQDAGPPKFEARCSAFKRCEVAGL